MLMIMVVIMKVKPMSSLKPKKLLQLYVDRDIDLTMMGNLIWMYKSLKLLISYLLGKCKNVYFIVFAPKCIYWNFNHVATPLWPSVGVKPNTPKVGDLESSRTPECLGFDSKAQNTSHWGVLGVIGKVLKRRYRKWPRIGHLDICNPRYG
jgi:hypothetical protein